MEATDFNADFTALSLTLVAFSALGEVMRFFSMVAERGRGVEVGAAGVASASRRVLPALRAARRSRLILSARAWRRFKSSARRLATESTAATFSGFLTYFLFKVVERWTRRCDAELEMLVWSTGLSFSMIKIYTSLVIILISIII